MPFALKGLTLPNGMLKCNLITNVVFLSLNLVFPLIEGILITITSYKYLNLEPFKKSLEASIISKICVGAMALPSCMFLGYAVIQIRSFLSKGISSK